MSERGRERAKFQHDVGDLVLVKWEDGMVYFAKIKKVDWRKKRCTVVFDDRSTDEALFSQIHSVDETTTDIICIKCKKDDSEPPNEIVLCDSCGIGFHQKCHNPSILPAALELDNPWQCAYCEKGTKNPYLTESINAMQSLFDEDLEDEDHMESDTAPSLGIVIKQEKLSDAEEEVNRHSLPPVTGKRKARTPVEPSRKKSKHGTRPLDALRKKYAKAHGGRSTDSWKRHNTRRSEAQTPSVESQTLSVTQVPQSRNANRISIEEKQPNVQEHQNEAVVEKESTIANSKNPQNAFHSSDNEEPPAKRPRSLRVSLTLPPDSPLFSGSKPGSPLSSLKQGNEMECEPPVQNSTSPLVNCMRASVSSNSSSGKASDGSDSTSAEANTSKDTIADDVFTDAPISPNTEQRSNTTTTSSSIVNVTATATEGIKSSTTTATEGTTPSTKSSTTATIDTASSTQVPERPKELPLLPKNTSTNKESSAPSKTTPTSNKPASDLIREPSPLERLQMEIRGSRLLSYNQSTAGAAVATYKAKQIKLASVASSSHDRRKSQSDKTTAGHNKETTNPSTSINSTSTITVTASNTASSTNAVSTVSASTPSSIATTSVCTDTVTPQTHDGAVVVISPSPSPPPKIMPVNVSGRKLISKPTVSPVSTGTGIGTTATVPAAEPSGNATRPTTVASKPKTAIDAVAFSKQVIEATRPRTITPPIVAAAQENAHKLCSPPPLNSALPPTNVTRPPPPPLRSNSVMVTPTTISATGEVGTVYTIVSPTSQSTESIPTTNINHQTSSSMAYSGGQPITYTAMPVQAVTTPTQPTYYLMEVKEPQPAQGTVPHTVINTTSKPYAVVNAIPASHQSAVVLKSPPPPPASLKIPPSSSSAAPAGKPVLNTVRHSRKSATPHHLPQRSTPVSTPTVVPNKEDETSTEIAQHLEQLSHKYRECSNVSEEKLMEIFQDAWNKFQTNGRKYEQLKRVQERSPNMEVVSYSSVPVQMSRGSHSNHASRTSSKYTTVAPNTSTSPVTTGVSLLQNKQAAAAALKNIPTTLQPNKHSAQAQPRYQSSGLFVPPPQAQAPPKQAIVSAHPNGTRATRTYILSDAASHHNPAIVRRAVSQDPKQHAAVLQTYNREHPLHSQQQQQQRVLLQQRVPVNNIKLLRMCVLCQKEATYLCSGCQKEWYCSKECQVKSWITHAKLCNKS